MKRQLLVLALCLLTLTGCGGGGGGTSANTSSTPTGSSGSNATTAVTNAVSGGSSTSRSYPIVDTSQLICYDNTKAVATPSSGHDFYGQDAQIAGSSPYYTVSSDGLTVVDNVTRLTWQRTPDTNGDGQINANDKFTWTTAQARPAAMNAARYGGYSDWRLPTIKELYSLIRFNGTDPSPSSTDTSALTPFIDSSVFGFAYGQSAFQERIIDSQYMSSTLYVSTATDQKVFGVNFADGRIKGYGLQGANGTGKTFYLLCVRDNSSYGVNQFTDNGDGTVSDAATGLMWTKDDSGSGMNWHDALAWAAARNAANHLGYADWRLPNPKELQSIVDYTRSPDTTSSAAIASVFTCTPITNEAGQADFPCYWTGTTHVSSAVEGARGCYVCFGRALGYMNGTWTDVHGAGAQRSDPKAGNASDYPQGSGPQGDAIRVSNYVRLVRSLP